MDQSCSGRAGEKAFRKKQGSLRGQTGNLLDNGKADFALQGRPGKQSEETESGDLGDDNGLPEGRDEHLEIPRGDGLRVAEIYKDLLQPRDQQLRGQNHRLERALLERVLGSQGKTLHYSFD